MIISNVKGVPNIPELKNKLKAKMDIKELAYAKTIASDFLNKTLVKKLFVSSCNESNEVCISRNFESVAFDGCIKKEIIEYAGLIIWANIFAEEDCPSQFEVNLDFKGKLESLNILYQIKLTSFA